jgi:inorganic pyrophosphatase
VPVSDPIWNSLNDLSAAFTKRNQHFFKLYKDLENKTVDVGGWEMLMKHTNH